jgi:hypothetical protein
VPEPTVQIVPTAAAVPVRVLAAVPIGVLSDDRLALLGQRCETDEHCRSGFCDRGRCADRSMYGLGDECDSKSWSYSATPYVQLNPSLHAFEFRSPGLTFRRWGLSL